VRIKRLNGNTSRISRAQIAYSESVLGPHVQGSIATESVLSVGPTERHIEWTGEGGGLGSLIKGKVLNSLV
jgi:hypothetical protein